MSNYDRLEHHSIVTRDMWGNVNYYSVREYEQWYEEGISQREASPYKDVHWTECLPRIEYLSPVWHKDRGMKIKIIDVELYNQQMREFLGMS